METNKLWTTALVEEARRKVESGEECDKSCFNQYDMNFRRANINFKYTQQEQEEVVRCANDILYYADKYCFAMTDDGIRKINLRPYQRRMLKCFQDNRFVCLLAARQTGKCHFSSKIYIKKNGKVYEENVNLLYYKALGKVRKLTFTEKITSSLYLLRDKLHNKFTNAIDWAIEKLESIQYKDADFDEDDITKKIIDEINLEDIYVSSDTGFVKAKKILKTQPYHIYKIKTENHYIECADRHILFDENTAETFAMDLIEGDLIMTDNGPEKILTIEKSKHKVCMFDMEIDSPEHRYYTNGILSHNTITTAIFISWYICFQFDKNVLVLANKLTTAHEIVDKIKVVLANLPFFLKPGIVTLQVGGMKFDNGVRLMSQATGKTAAIGFTIHLLYADEFAHIPEHLVVPFYRSIYPTLSSSQVSRIVISSTPNGLNLYHQIYDGAVHGTNAYAACRVDWWEVPGRDEAWRQREIANLGSEELFNQEYGNQFLVNSRMLLDNDIAMVIKKQSEKYVWKEISQMFELSYDYDELKWHPSFDPTNIDPHDQFVMAMDIADGIGGDYTIVNILRLECKSLSKIRTTEEFDGESSFFRLREVGMFRSNKRSVDDVSRLMHILLFKVFNPDNVRVVMEANHKGEAMFEKISANKNFYPEIFMHTQQNKALKARRPGVKIQSDNKDMYCRELRKMLQHHRIVVTNEDTAIELQQFGINKNGKFEAQTGHDDCAMTLVNLVPYFENITFTTQVEELYDSIDERRKKAIDIMIDSKTDNESDMHSDTYKWLQAYM